MNQTAYDALALIIPLVIAIVFHEVAHGLVARQLGDPTAQEARRLSLNPLRHVDPIGTIVVPGFLALIKAPVFGWAKPVPVDFRRLRHPRSGMMLVAIAGPATNIVLGAGGAVILGLVLRPYDNLQQLAEPVAFVVKNLFNFILINIFLALFNLLPIPPFDGSHIVEGALPPTWGRHYARLRPFGFPLVLLLVVVLPELIPGFDFVQRTIGVPVQWLTGLYLALAQAVAGL